MPSSSELVAEAVRDTLERAPAPARPPSVSGGEPGSAADTILPIVTAQRERFRSAGSREGGDGRPTAPLRIASPGCFIFASLSDTHSANIHILKMLLKLVIFKTPKNLTLKCSVFVASEMQMMNPIQVISLIRYEKRNVPQKFTGYVSHAVVDDTFSR